MCGGRAWELIATVRYIEDREIVISVPRTGGEVCSWVKHFIFNCWIAMKLLCICFSNMRSFITRERHQEPTPICNCSDSATFPFQQGCMIKSMHHVEAVTLLNYNAIDKKSYIRPCEDKFKYGYADQVFFFFGQKQSYWVLYTHMSSKVESYITYNKVENSRKVHTIYYNISKTCKAFHI